MKNKSLQKEKGCVKNYFIATINISFLKFQEFTTKSQ